MSKHTAEPWQHYAFGPDAPIGPYIVAMTVNAEGMNGPIRGYTIACGMTGAGASTYWPARGAGGRSDDEAEANAARIVACVNACKGINPEAVPDLVEAAKAALYDLKSFCHAYHVDPDRQPAIAALRAALAKAEPT